MDLPKLKQLFLTGNNITNIDSFLESNLPNFNLINIYDS